MCKVAFYATGSKGYFVIDNFIKKHGADNIAYIVSAPDKNIKSDFYSEIMEVAASNNIPFFDRKKDIKKITQIENHFDGYKFAISWKWIINKTENLIVLHDSLLPKYRGFAPLVNSLIAGERFIGVTAIFANEDYDCGDIIAQRKIEISYPIKIEEAIKLIEPLYFDLVDEIFMAIKNKRDINRYPQDHTKATYSPWLDDLDYFIDWTWDSEKIKRFVDAVGYPYDGAKAYLNGKIVRILSVDIVDDVVIEDRMRHIGKIIFFREGKPVVICGKGLIKINEITDLKGNKIIPKFRSRFR